ncbi:MFS transporter [Streptomyces albus]|nr:MULTISPECIES: MFS transporter [Streptomyces]
MTGARTARPGGSGTRRARTSLGALGDIRLLPPFARLLAGTQLAFNIGFFAVLPYLAAHLGGTLGMGGWLVGLVLGLRTFSQQGLFVVGGALTDRFGPRPVVLAGCLLRIAGFVWLGYAHGTGSVVAAVVCVGFAAALFSPAVESETARQAVRHETATGYPRARTLAVFSAAGQAGAFLGPLLGSLLLLADFRTACLAGAAVFVAVLAGHWHWMPHGRPDSTPPPGGPTGSEGADGSEDGDAGGGDGGAGDRSAEAGRSGERGASGGSDPGGGSGGRIVSAGRAASGGNGRSSGHGPSGGSDRHDVSAECGASGECGAGGGRGTSTECGASAGGGGAEAGRSGGRGASGGSGGHDVSTDRATSTGRAAGTGRAVGDRRRVRRSEGGAWRATFRNGPFLLLCLAHGTYLLAYNQLYLTLPEEVVRATGSQTALGWLFALSSLLVVCAQLPVTRAVGERLDHRAALCGGLAVVAAGFLTVAATAPLGLRGAVGLVPAAVYVLALTFGQMLAVPASRALVTELVPAERLGFGMGVLSSFGGAVVLAGSSATGALFGTGLGPAAVWSVLAGVPLLGAVAGRAVRVRRAAG